jgi:hypothetical protein
MAFNLTALKHRAQKLRPVYLSEQEAVLRCCGYADHVLGLDPRDDALAFNSKAKTYRIHVGFSPNAVQEAILRSEADRKILVLPRRAGKTTTILMWLHARSLLHPNTLHWYVAPTYKQAKRIAWAKAKNLFSHSVLAAPPNESELTLRLRNGSIVSLIGADDPDSLRGDGLKSAGLDEFATMKREAWEIGIQPALSDNDGHALFGGTPNALRGPHFQELYLKAKHGILRDEGWVVVKATSQEIPHIDPRKIEQARKELRPWQFRQEYEASWETLSGKVWPDFQDSSYEAGGHVVPAPEGSTQMRPPHGWEVIAGIDWGWVHPMAVVWLAIGPQGQAMVVAEFVAQSTYLVDAAREIRRISQLYGGVGAMQFYADPSRPEFIDELQDTYGIPTTKANNSRELGIDRVGRLFGKRLLLVGSCCTSVIRGVIDYSYDPRATVPRVLRENDDEVDALRYAVMGAFPPTDAEREDSTEGEWEEDDTFLRNWRINEEEAKRWQGEIIDSRR